MTHNEFVSIRKGDVLVHYDDLHNIIGEYKVLEDPSHSQLSDYMYTMVVNDDKTMHSIKEYEVVDRECWCLKHKQHGDSDISDTSCQQMVKQMHYNMVDDDGTGNNMRVDAFKELLDVAAHINAETGTPNWKPDLVSPYNYYFL